MILCFKRNKRSIWYLNNFIQFSMQHITTIRSSRSQMFLEIGVLKVCNIHRKRLCWSLFLVKFQAWRPVALLKRDSNRDVFLWILRSFWENIFQRTLPVAALYFKSVGNSMTYINREIEGIYFQYNTLYLYYVFLHFFRYQFCESY